MQELDAQFLDRSLQAPLWQVVAEVPKGKIENEKAQEIATPAAARIGQAMKLMRHTLSWEIWMRML